MNLAELRRQIEWLKDGGRSHLDRHTTLKTLEWCEDEIRSLREELNLIITGTKDG